MDELFAQRTIGPSSATHRPSRLNITSYSIARVSRIQVRKNREFYYHQNNLADKVPTLTEMSYSVGSLLGPILGGQLYVIFGWTQTCNIFGTVSLIFSFVYLFIILIPECRHQDKVTMAPLDLDQEHKPNEEDELEGEDSDEVF